MKLFEKGELKLLWPFYLDSLISTILFFAPAFYIVYFRELNLSLFQIGLLLAIPSATSLLFEIPTGAIADVYGRKKSVLFGIFLEAIAISLLFFFNDFYIMAGVFGFIGIASTLITGANEAWIIDLINSKNKNLVTGFFAKQESIANIGLILAGIIGAVLVKEFGTNIIWPFAGAALLITIFILSFAKEVHTPKATNLKDSYKEIKNQTRNSISYIKKNRTLFSLLLASMIAALAFTPLSLGWVPLLQDMTFPDHAFGYLYSALAFTGVIGPILSQKLLKKGNERRHILVLISITIALTLLIITAVNIPITIAIVLGLVFFGEMRFPIQIAYFHKFVPSKLRATIGSVKAMALSAISIIVVPLAGLIMDNVGPRLTIFYAGFIAIPAAYIYYQIKEKKSLAQTIAYQNKIPHHASPLHKKNITHKI
jgi:MFS family permease